MKKIISIIFIILIIVIGNGCDKNTKVKLFGGTAELKLPPGEKLINVTWKDSQLWYLTRPMKTNEKCDTFYFHEKSQYGMIEGTYILIETVK
jgi:hypothetical protein